MGIRFFGATALAVGLIALSAATAQASTTDVYYDARNNIATRPDPFPSLDPSALDNTALGMFALEDVSTGSFNTGVGDRALENVDTGDSNVGVGTFAG